jgi:hypothetical protein
MYSSVSLNELVGQNVARHRARYGLTLESIATAARAYGVKWNVSRVRELEAGQLGVPVQNLLVLAQVFFDLTGERRQLVDFFEGARRVRVTPELEVPTSQVYDAIGGQAVVIKRQEPKPLSELPPMPEGPMPEVWTKARDQERVAAEAWDGDDYSLILVTTRISKRIGLTDERAMKQLGQSAGEWTYWCAALWRRCLRDERDARLDNRVGANPQRTGHITRQLIDEMSEFITSHGGQTRG